MRILQTIASMGAKSGGTSTATFDLLSAINGLGLPEGDAVHLASLDVRDGSGDRNLADGRTWSRAVPNDGRTSYQYSRNLRRFLKEEPYDIYHTNGMWLDVNHATCAAASRFGKPYVITPHGMLYPEALQRSAWKKWPLRKLFFDKDILQASCLHATCETEAHHIRTLGYKGPVAVIGNPVVCPAIAEKLISERSYSAPFSTKRIGFLGRLHPIKAVENIIRAVALKPEKNVEINIMGSGSSEYETFLRSETERLGIAERVHFLGFVNGDAKFEQLARLDALFVPSDMENFGMIIPEALLVGTPVMASLGTPWQSLNEECCGWWTDNSPESIAKVIGEIETAAPERLREMGSRGRRLVIDRFAATKVAASMFRLYQWLAGTASKPEFVYDE